MRNLKKFDDMTREELFTLAIDLINDGAEVQGMDNAEFAELFGVEWGEED